MIELALTILAAFAMVSAPFNPVPEAQQGARTPILLDEESLAAVAHRGCWQNAPENSIAAIRSCEARGIRIVEIDVRLTRDGVPVLIHDGTVDRTTTGTGPVSDLTLLQLQQLALLNRDGSDPSDVTDEAIPTLADVLELVTAGTVLNLDVKEDIYEQVWSVVDQYGQDNRLILKSRQPEDLLLYNGRAQNGKVFLMPLLRSAQTVYEGGGLAGKPRRAGWRHSRMCTIRLSSLFSRTIPFWTRLSEAGPMMNTPSGSTPSARHLRRGRLTKRLWPIPMPFGAT